jgi:membrane protein implicated in regulation of membrane protease activity
VLAAEIWHWWIAIVLFAVSVLAVALLGVGYLKNITSTRYPNRRQRDNS